MSVQAEFENVLDNATEEELRVFAYNICLFSSSILNTSTVKDKINKFSEIQCYVKEFINKDGNISY